MIVLLSQWCLTYIQVNLSSSTSWTTVSAKCLLSFPRLRTSKKEKPNETDVFNFTSAAWHWRCLFLFSRLNAWMPACKTFALCSFLDINQQPNKSEKKTWIFTYTLLQTLFNAVIAEKVIMSKVERWNSEHGNDDKYHQS